MDHEENAKAILVPAGTGWPFIAALGTTLMFTALVTHVAVGVVGLIVLLRAAVGWWRDVLPEQTEEAVSVSASDLERAQVPRSRLPVAHLVGGASGHRAQIPVEVHPYWTGIYGGAAGAVAMSVVAVIFGLISQRSVWYPINLLAAGVLASLTQAPISQLREFSASGLIVGSLIHGTMSLLVGMLYAVSLPMFPRGASWRSGLVTPLLWTGLVAATLSLINPTMNQRIEWGWFVGSQIAFGLTCGWVIARTEKIETMQNWSLAERAQIEGRNSERTPE